MELGCSTILYGGCSLDDALDSIAQAGYKAIELCARPGMAPHVEVGKPASYYREIRDKIESRGLAIESVAGTDGISMTSDEFPRVLEAVHLVGAPFLAEGAGGKAGMVEDESFSAEYEASLRGVVDILNRAGEQAAEYDVRLTIKPHVGTAIHSCDSILLAAKYLDLERVGINYDASHIWRSGARAEDPVEVLKKVKAYVTTLRIRDNRASRERPIGTFRDQIPGRGAMELPALVEVMKTIDGVPYVVLEIVGMHLGTGVSQEVVQRVAQEAYAYLAPLFA